MSWKNLGLWCRAAIVLFASVAAFGQSPTAGGVMTGRYWVALPDVAKAWYLVGFFDGVMAGSEGTRLACKAAAFASSTPLATCLVMDHEWDTPKSVGDIGEVVKGVDVFFSAPENLGLRVSDAISIFFMKVTGRPQAQIDQALNFLRQSLTH